MHATRAAVEEGIVPGGGVAFVRAARTLEKFRIYKDGEGDADEQIGVNIVKRALEEPMRLIAQNAGREGAIVVGRVRAEKNENVGFNALTEEFEDLVKAGVIDPTKVTRAALQNAASIAGLLLTTEAMISDFPETAMMPARGRHGLLTASDRKGMRMNIIEQIINDVTVLIRLQFPASPGVPKELKKPLSDRYKRNNRLTR